MSTWKSDFSVIRETVRTAKEVAQRELKDPTTAFCMYKNPKAHKGGSKEKIPASDIAWYLGPVWQKGYQRELIADVIGAYFLIITLIKSIHKTETHLVLLLCLLAVNGLVLKTNHLLKIMLYITLY